MDSILKQERTAVVRGGLRADMSTLLAAIGQDAAVVQIARCLFAFTLVLIVCGGITTLWESESRLYALFSGQVRLSKEGAFAEFYGHGLSFLSAVVFLGCYFDSKRKVFLLAMCLLAFAWFDDSLQYHEKFGGFLVETFELTGVGRVGAQNIGELLAWGLVAPILLVIAIWAWMGRQKGDAAIFAALALVAVIFAVFGIFFDIVHGVLGSSTSVGALFGTFEDGGELLAITLTASLALGFFRVEKVYKEMHLAQETNGTL